MKKSYIIDFSDFWDKMVSGEISFLTGLENLAQKLHSHLYILKNNSFNENEHMNLTKLVIVLQELIISLQTNQKSYNDIRSKFETFNNYLVDWSKRNNIEIKYN